MKDVATGGVIALAASYDLPSAGPVEMLGWQLAEPLHVTRIAIGTPTADAAARIRRP